MKTNYLTESVECILSVSHKDASILTSLSVLEIVALSNFSKPFGQNCTSLVKNT